MISFEGVDDAKIWVKEQFPYEFRVDANQRKMCREMFGKFAEFGEAPVTKKLSVVRHTAKWFSIGITVRFRMASDATFFKLHL